MRLFFAVPIEEPLRSAIASRQSAWVRADHNIRWTSADQLHLTLLFLGESPDERLEAVLAAADRALNGLRPGALAFAGPGLFSRRDRHIFWIGLRPEEWLLQAAERLAAGLAEFVEKKESRPFVPHLTVGRSRTGRHVRTDFLHDFQHDVLPGISQEKSRIVLFRSILHPDGPEHLPMKHWE